jgi:arginine/lysine/ornithine decarboxylase
MPCPSSRGNSVFKSRWIQDFGDFYGRNLFLAETSSTSGGLDSLLQPTGPLKKAQERAARAFGSQFTYFATNGTSTSNKIVLQALVEPHDMVLIDRDCHKSHHYGLALTGAFPVYLDSYPLPEFSMYGAVPLEHIREKIAGAEKGRAVAPREDVAAHQLHLRRRGVQRAARDGTGARHQARHRVPVGRGLVRLCAASATSSSSAPPCSAAARLHRKYHSPMPTALNTTRISLR